MRRTTLAILLSLLLVGVPTMALTIHPAEADGTIYIRPDGSVDPSDAPISTIDNATYTLIGDINGSIIVERDNVVVDGAGYRVQTGPVIAAIDLTGRTGVTIKNFDIEGEALFGVHLSEASKNRVYGNRITSCSLFGIALSGAWNNTIFENFITDSHGGIVIGESTLNYIFANTIANSTYSVSATSKLEVYNKLYHNNFINNPVEQISNVMYVWHDGYPSGGNYWSNYNGTDLYQGPCQNETGSDGIGDTAYVIDGVNEDKYPLMNPWYPRIKNLNTLRYYDTIQEAINNATEGDTIFVRNGTYFEHLVVNKTLTLQGENRNTTIIDAEYLFPSVVNVTANNVQFSGFTIQHCSSGGRALWLDNYGNMTFSHNIITGCNEGVRLHRSSGNVVSENIVQDCYYNTGVGIDYGINNTVHRNTIIHNHYGLSGGIDCHGNTFSENTIIYNDIGFGTTSYDNKFFHNNFVNNSVHVIASGMNQFDDGYHSEGNYWSDYNGTDSDGNGIGDTPYVVDTNNTDNYPLMNLYWSPGDIDHDLDIDIFDLVRCAGAYGSTPSDLNWNPHCDIAEPYGIINIFDIVTIAASYGEEYTP